MTFPLMLCDAALFGGPRLVVPGGRRPLAAATDRAAREIGKGRTGHVWLVRLFPGIPRAVGARQFVDRVVQPGMPFRRHLRSFRLAIIDDPAFLAAGPAPAAPQRLSTALTVIAVTVRIGADQFAAKPGEQARAERHRFIHASSSPRSAFIAPLAVARKALPSRNIWCGFEGVPPRPIDP